MRIPDDRIPARVTRFVLLLAGLVIAVTLTGFPARVLNSYEVNQRVLVLEQRLAEREAENAALQQELARRGTESYVRTVAKERLGLVEPGEALLLLPLDGVRAASAPGRTNAAAAVRSPAATPYDAEWGYFLQWLEMLKRSFA